MRLALLASLAAFLVGCGSAPTPTERGFTLPPAGLWTIAAPAPGEATADEPRLYISQPRPPLGNAPSEKRLAFLFLPDGRVLTNASYAGGVVETPAASLMNTVLLKLEVAKWYVGRYQIADGKVVVESYCPSWKGQRYDAWAFLHFDLAITSKTNLRLLETREKHRPLNGFDGEPSFAGRSFVRLPLEGPITVEQTW
jgi:hypothetical protein